MNHSKVTEEQGIRRPTGHITAQAANTEDRVWSNTEVEKISTMHLTNLLITLS